MANLAAQQAPKPTGSTRRPDDDSDNDTTISDDELFPTLPANVQAALSTAPEGSSLSQLGKTVERAQEERVAAPIQDIAYVGNQILNAQALANNLPNIDDFSGVASKEELEELATLKQTILAAPDHFSDKADINCCRCDKPVKSTSAKCIICKHGVHKSKKCSSATSQGVVCVHEKCKNVAKMQEIIAQLQSKK